MPFQKGHKFGKGRPKKIQTQVKDWAKEHPYAVAELMQALYDKGIQGDAESAKYVIDRIKGKPKQQTDIDIKGQVLITPDMRVLAAKEMLEIKVEESKLLIGGSDAAE